MNAFEFRFRNAAWLPLLAAFALARPAEAEGPAPKAALGPKLKAVTDPGTVFGPWVPWVDETQASIRLEVERLVPGKYRIEEVFADTKPNGGGQTESDAGATDAGMLLSQNEKGKDEVAKDKAPSRTSSAKSGPETVVIPTTPAGAAAASVAPSATTKTAGLSGLTEAGGGGKGGTLGGGVTKSSRPSGPTTTTTSSVADASKLAQNPGPGPGPGRQDSVPSASAASSAAGSAAGNGESVPSETKSAPAIREEYTEGNLISLRATGLRPGARYRVFVELGEQRLESRFATPGAATEPFTFFVYGDNRTDDEAHARVVKAMLDDPSGQFLVHTGDFVGKGSSKADWASFFRIEKGLLGKLPIFSCVGNHELWSNGGIEYAKYFAPTLSKQLAANGDETKALLRSSVRWNNTQFLFLNAMTKFGTEEKEWVQRELAKVAGDSRILHRFVVLHHGPFSSGPHGSNKPFLDAGMIDVLVNGKVDLVLSGHDHLYERGFARGLRYVVSGGGGAPTYPVEGHAEGSRRAESARHYVRVRVDGANINLRTIRPEGTLLEECTGSATGWGCDPIKAEEKPKPKSSGCAVAAADDGSSDGPRAAVFGLLAFALIGRRRRRANPETVYRQKPPKIRL
jgi:acid phosphatase type 7